MRYLTEVNINVVVAFDINCQEMSSICAFGVGLSRFGLGRSCKFVYSRDFDDQFYFVMKPSSSYYTMAETVILHGIYSYVTEEMAKSN